jgi:hypothetical protein
MEGRSLTDLICHTDYSIEDIDESFSSSKQIFPGKKYNVH